MNISNTFKRFTGGMAISLLTTILTPCLAAKPHAPAKHPAQKGDSRMETIALWPGAAPGEKDDIGEEKDTTPPADKKLGKKYVTRLGNVSVPMLTVFRPAANKNTGAAVVVCPGGGYSILAYDLEGSEVCKWLNSIGVTAFLLKYRVPRRAGLEKHAAPLQDAQRALGLVRHSADEYDLDQNRIGILGFSAGGHLSVMASTQYDNRTYPTVDDADKENCRPDFTILIYPAYLNDEHDPTHLAPEIKVTANTPPTFIAMTEDDQFVTSAFAYAPALRNAKVPFEMHLYPRGGHGYGLRPSKNAVSQWPKRAGEWLKSEGWLKPRA